MQPTDEALVMACRRGDADAWDLLVDRYQRLIYNIARHSGLDREQAADTMQRVFTILLERLDTIEQPAQIGAWMVITARREAWAARRRERAAQARTVADAEGSLALLADDAILPEEQVERLEAQQRVRRAVAELDGRCRDLLTMLFLQPAPPAYSEVAAALGMREGAVGPTRARCLQKLRQLLEEEG